MSLVSVEPSCFMNEQIFAVSSRSAGTYGVYKLFIKGPLLYVMSTTDPWCFTNKLTIAVRCESIGTNGVV